MRKTVVYHLVTAFAIVVVGFAVRAFCTELNLTTDDVFVSDATQPTNPVTLRQLNLSNSFPTSVAAQITSSDTNDWATAYSWGDHATNGYLTTEVDPYFSVFETNRWLNHTNDPSAHHARYTDTEATNAAEVGGYALKTWVQGQGYASNAVTNEVAADITSDDTNNWTTAYGWGDHSTNGYLTVETDPVFSTSVAASVTVSDTSNWTTAYSWGDHATNGYLTVETDPIFTSSVAYGIDAPATTRWETAYSWGDHAVAGYARTGEVIAVSSRVDVIESNTQNWNEAYSWGDHATNGYLTTELDPVWSGVSNQYATTSEVVAVSSRVDVIEGNTSNWNEAYSWGDHALAGYASTSEVLAVSSRVDTVEANTSNWNEAYSWGDHALAGYAGTGEVVAVSGRVDVIESNTQNWNTAYESYLGNTNVTRIFSWDDIDGLGAANAPYTYGYKMVKDVDKRLTTLIDVPDDINTNEPIYLGWAVWPQSGGLGAGETTAVFQTTWWNVSDLENLNGASDAVVTTTNNLDGQTQYDLNKVFHTVPLAVVTSDWDGCIQIELKKVGSSASDTIKESLGAQTTLGLKYTRKNYP